MKFKLAKINDKDRFCTTLYWNCASFDRLWSLFVHEGLVIATDQGQFISQVLNFYCITCSRSKSGTNYNHNGAAELTIKIGLLAYHAKLHCNGPVKLLKTKKKHRKVFETMNSFVFCLEFEPLKTTCIQDALKNVVHTSTAVIAHDTKGAITCVTQSTLNP